MPCLALLCSHPLLAGEKPLALVIGNATYENEKPLVNTLNDARDIRDELKKLEFEVMYDENLSQKQMNTLLNRFIRRLQQGKRTGLFYYSGHGTQVHEKNYLIPVDARIKDELDVADESVAISKLFRAMRQRDKSVNLVILDACRDNPFQSGKGGGGKGLAVVDSREIGGTLVLYAASPNEKASDNPYGRNGLFTKHLLKAMRQPGISAYEAFRKVSTNVYRESNRKQRPWPEGILPEPFYFSGEGKPLPTPTPAPTPVPKPEVADRYETRFWDSVERSNNRALIGIFWLFFEQR